MTVAAHDRHVSRREHEALGLDFPYPHLVQEEQWQRYIKGYRDADVIVCPSTVAAETVRNYGPEFRAKRIEVIPHGCELPVEIKPPPQSFVVGYLGSYGADKGVRYLLEAWNKLDYADAVLMLGGRDSTHPWVQQLVHRYGGGNVWARGWINNVSDFYNDCTLYVQPSASEGYGCEVLEAMAHGRPVVCSNAAGARDLLQDSSAGIIVRSRDANDLAGAIDNYKCRPSVLSFGGESAAEQAKGYTWDKIRAHYQQLWRSMLA